MKNSLLLAMSIPALCALSACGGGASGSNSGGGGGGGSQVATHFSVAGPATASVGTPFNITVVALDAANNPVLSYSGTVQFTSTDPQAVLAGNSTLVNGTKGFSEQLMTIGSQTITATDTVKSTITGMSNAIQVSTPASGIVPTGSMATPRYFHTATLLNNGTVLVTGGVSGGNGLASAEIFDPVSGTFSATGSMAAGRSSHTATLLNNGKVLVTGGGSATAELFDPASGQFTATGSMTISRTGQTATLLKDGRVVVTGGNATGGETATAETYDPVSGTFTSTGSMETVRWGHTAPLLSDGRVLVAGGIGGGTGNAGYLTSAEIFDPASGAFAATGSMKTKRWWHEATLLENGSVLVSGGVDLFRTVTSEAELFDPASGTFTPTGSMTNMRRIHTSTLLNNGKVLVTGGEYFVKTQALLSLATAEIFDPASGGFTPTMGNMETARSGHTATLLNDGRVLVAGGLDFTAQGSTVLASAEIFN
jgi:hypothetical protein